MDVNEDHEHDDLAPGKDCPTCKRRVPYPKTPQSPTSKVFAYRVPDDAIESHDEIMEAAARHLGVYDEPMWRYKVVLSGAVLILQGENFEGRAA